MRKIKFGNTLMIISVLFFLAYNTYFGWNKLPESDIEQTCDNIFNLGMILGIVWYLLPMVKVYEDFIKSKEIPNSNNNSMEVDYIITADNCIYSTRLEGEFSNQFIHIGPGSEIAPIGNNGFRVKYFDFYKQGYSTLGEKDPLNQTIDIFPPQIKKVYYK